MFLMKTMRLRATLLATSSLVATTLALAAGGIGAMAPSAAWADNECGTGGNVTCTPALNPYPNGVTYFPAAGDQTIHIQSGVVIDSSAGFNTGVLVIDNSGKIVIDAPTNVTVTAGSGGAFGLLLATTDTDITVNLDKIRNTQAGVEGVLLSSSTGNLSYTGNSITTTGVGVDAGTNNGNITVKVGTVATTDAGATGVSALSQQPGSGNVSVTTTTVTTTGANAAGINATTSSGLATVASGSVSTTGAGATGIIANSGNLATVTSASVTTAGTNATGISVNSNRSGGASVTSGTVSATGVGSVGIQVMGNKALSVSTGAVTANSTGVLVSTLPVFGFPPLTGPGTATVTTTGDITSATADAIDAFTQAGTVSVTTGVGTKLGAVNGNGVRAVSNGIGDGGVDGVSDGAVTVVNNAAIGGVAAVKATGIEATISNVASKGLISVSGAGSVNAGGVGILATNAGAGTTAVTAGGAVTALDDAIRVSSVGAYTVGVGGATTSTTANGVQASGTAGGIVTVTGALRGLGTSAATAVVDLTAPTGVTTTLTNTGGSIRSTNATLSGAAGDLAIRSTGGTVVVNNGGRIDGRMDYSATGVGSKVTVNNTGAGGLHTTGLTTFSVGNDTFNNTATGLLATSGAATYDFGADTGVAPRDVFNNSGAVVAGEAGAASTFTLTGLETFNNSGQIVFGSTTGGVSSDRLTNSRVVMTGTGGGTAFVGSGASLLVFDANLGVTAQTNCAAAVTADCLSLPGGSFGGSNRLRVINTSAGGGGLNTGIVLVDAPGGAVAPGSFTLDAGSTNYVTRGGQGGVDTGFFVYRLVPIGTSQIALVSSPDTEAFQFSSSGAISNDIWYTTTGGWFDREADIRQGLAETGGDRHAGVWIKMVGDWTRRRGSQTTTVLGTSFTSDSGYNQNTAALIGGVDLISGSSKRASWVLGVNGGYVDSNTRFHDSATTTDITGSVAGAYASVISGGWYADATVAGDFLRQNVNMPTFTPTSALNARGKIKTWGGQVESGYRFGALGLSIEPFGSFSYVRTRFDDLTVPGGSIQFANAVSERGSLGIRLSTAMPTDGWTLKPTVYGRVWDEFKGAESTTLINPGAPFLATDDFHGVFGEVGTQVGLFSKGGVSAFFDSSFKWKAGYQAYTARVGMNYRF